MVLVTSGFQPPQRKASAPTETSGQVFFSPAAAVYKLEPELTSSLPPLLSPGEDDGQGATALRKRLCCRAQPLNSATFREPHTCFKGLLFALESSSEMLRLQTLNTSVRRQELLTCPCPPAKAGLGPCVELPRFWGGGGRGQRAACARHSLCGW